jgi:carbon-monoxide dehydrogenase medium subunit
VKPAPFTYLAPATLGEVTAELAEWGDDAKVLAGGQSLVPMLNLRLTRFDALVDITGVDELRALDITDDGVRVGAATRHHVLEETPELWEAAPLLPLAAAHIGHFQIRNRGTVCGSVAHADPAAELPAVSIVLGAQMEVAGPGGTRQVDAADFFTGTWTTVLDSDEVLAAIRFPRWASTARFAVEEVARREGDFAIAGAVVAIDTDGQAITRAAIGLFGLGETPLRARAAEAALTGASVSSVDLEEVARLAVDGLDPPEDLHASSGLRARIGAAVVQRGLARALRPAGGPS